MPRERVTRITIYVPKRFMEALRKSYSECRTDGEIVVKHLMEVHAG